MIGNKSKISEQEDKISVIMPVYNRLNLVDRAIESVRNQTYSNWELLIINDGSTDDISILNRWVEKDKRIKLINNRHEGVSAARNIGIEEATGTYIAFLDSDDLFKPNKLQKQLKYMKEKGCDFCHTAYERIDEEGNYIKKIMGGRHEGKVFVQIINSCSIGTVTVMIKKEVIGDTRFIKEYTVAQDICFWIDIAYKCEFGYIEEALSQGTYVQSSTSKSVEKVIRGFKNIINHVSTTPEYAPYIKYLARRKEIIQKYENGVDISRRVT